jgi:YggT family protein
VIVLANILVATGSLLKTVTTLYMLVVIASAVITWFPVDPWHPVVRFIRAVTDPVYDRVRKIMPRALWNTGIDLTPALIIIVLWFLNYAIFQSLIDLGLRMR